MTGINITAEAKARLTLFHGINQPTDRETALYVLYGEKAPFLQNVEQAYRNVTNNQEVLHHEKNGTRESLIQYQRNTRTSQTVVR